MKQSATDIGNAFPRAPAVLHLGARMEGCVHVVQEVPEMPIPENRSARVIDAVGGALHVLWPVCVLPGGAG